MLINNVAALQWVRFRGGLRYDGPPVVEGCDGEMAVSEAIRRAVSAGKLSIGAAYLHAFLRSLQDGSSLLEYDACRAMDIDPVKANDLMEELVGAGFVHLEVKRGEAVRLVFQLKGE